VAARASCVGTRGGTATCDRLHHRGSLRTAHRLPGTCLAAGTHAARRSRIPRARACAVARTWPETRTHRKAGSASAAAGAEAVARGPGSAERVAAAGVHPHSIRAGARPAWAAGSGTASTDCATAHQVQACWILALQAKAGQHCADVRMVEIQGWVRVNDGIQGWVRGFGG